MAIQVIFQNWLNLHATTNSSILSPSIECTVAFATFQLHWIYGHNVTKIHTHTATPTLRHTHKYCVCARNEWYNILLFNSISSLTVKYADEQLCCKHYQKSSMSINREIIIVRYPLICSWNCKWHINSFLGAIAICLEYHLQQLNGNYFWFWKWWFPLSTLHQIGKMPDTTKCNRMETDLAGICFERFLPQNSPSTFQCFRMQNKTKCHNYINCFILFIFLRNTRTYHTDTVTVTHRSVRYSSALY